MLNGKMIKKFEIAEGEDYYIWQYNYSEDKVCLAQATIWKCECCSKLTTVNAVWIVGTNDIDKTKAEANEVGQIDEELCLGEDGSNTCEACYYSKQASEE